MCYEHKVKVKAQIINEEIKSETKHNSLLPSNESKRDLNSNNIKLKHHLDKMNYLMSVDIALSKPIFVRKSSNLNDKKQTKEAKDDEKFDIIDKVIKRKKSEDFLNTSLNSIDTSTNTICISISTSIYTI